MNIIKKIFDKAKPNFEEGGRFSKLHSTFDAFETLFFVPATTNKNGVHVRDYMDMKRTMIIVVIAVFPALLFGIWNTGYQHSMATGIEVSFWAMVWHGFIKVFPIIVVSYITGLSIEFGFAQWRKHEVNEGFLVTGMLIPLVLPVNIPLWMVVIATAFAVVIGKEVFGGTGMNIWNPALLARAFLFFAYPAKMSGDTAWISGLSKGEGIVDGFSGATALANAANGNTIPSLWDSFTGIIPGSIGETSTAAILLGAILLLYTGIGSWKIMFSVFAGGFLMALTFNCVGSNS
jgi:Na+-transporting NADH:ubiquinone oxidoreductase subunit B